LNICHTLKYLGLALLAGSILSACSVAKIEAGFEANPQCKEVINSKAGAIMPCAGSEQLMRSRAVALSSGAPTSAPMPVFNANNAISAIPVATTSTAGAPVQATPVVAPQARPILPCKPQMNTKTGSIMPCPNG